ncbi:Sulfate starvation-induced protein 7 [Moraxella lacunata]|uniref:Sulfate starvation-induced protein 7 n=1 Tax=Moraxella lacunata TaxID=477 RepID=A0A378T804_MORLA|nr:transporter substrate-binding domain-containing protein [Moraxella lacunata]STZ56003.1 Sulfate starvation-induced protein 7 [Moraxella lacunata]
MNLIKKSVLMSVCAFLVACNTMPTTYKIQAPTPEPTLQTFVVAVDDDYPPYDFFDDKGQATGFDVDILRAIGAKQNIPFTFKPVKWDNMVEGLENKKFQVALSGFAYSDERAKQYQVSNTYAYGQDIIVTLKANEQTNIPQTREELKGKKVITLGNSPYIEELESVLGKGNPNIIGVPNSLLMLQGLVDGTADVALTDKIVAQYYAQSFPNAKFNLTGTGDYFEPYPLVIVANKDEAELMKKINAGLVEIVKDGTYSKIYQNWFGETPKQLPEVK